MLDPDGSLQDGGDAAAEAGRREPLRPLPAPHGGGGEPRLPTLPPGVLRARLGPGANCSSAGSAIDVLFYGSVLAGALAVALAAALPPTPPRESARDPRAPDPHGPGPGSSGGPGASPPS
ncbi:MAG: hypothetical protein IT372_07310 [Polyangiaceae bacterium]|nr:hypothetical protein [Polyangiaceae bacterium]